MRRLLATCLAAGLTLLYARGAEAMPSLELTTTSGGADGGEYLVRVANPDATNESGVIELRRFGSDDAVARAPFDVPAKSTRYYRIPGDKGRQLGAFAVTSYGTVRAQEHFQQDGTVVIFDIPPRDEQRLHELRVHSSTNATVTHAAFDDTTKTPVLTRRAAAYDGVTLVLVPTSTFLALPDAERNALTAWVRTGGTIALSVTEERDLVRVWDLVGKDHVRSTSFGGTADLGLGHVHLLAIDPWSAASNGNSTVQEQLVELADHARVTNRFMDGGIWSEVATSFVDPNEGYRSVMAIAAFLLVAQALGTAFAFRRLALRRGMGPAYRFVVGSSVAAFATVCGLGIYAKGGFGPRARELTFADAASGESIAAIQRNRMYYASDTRSIDVTPRDASNLLSWHDTRATVRVDAANENAVLGDVGLRPWQATVVMERGTTAIGGGVRVDYDQGKILVRNASGATLRNVLVATPAGTCFSFGDIANGGETTSGTPHACNDLGPAWAEYDSRYPVSVSKYVATPSRLTLLGQLEEGPTSSEGFRFQKRTTLLRVTNVGGAS